MKSLSIAAALLAASTLAAQAAVCTPGSGSGLQPFTDANGYLQVHICLDDAGGGGGGTVTQGPQGSSTSPWFVNEQSIEALIHAAGTTSTNAMAVQGATGGIPFQVGVAQGSSVTGLFGPMIQTMVTGGTPTPATAGTVHAPYQGTDGNLWTAVVPSALAAVGLVPLATSAGDMVAKASAGNLYEADASGVSGNLVVINATTVPTSGATITPLECKPVTTTTTAQVGPMNPPETYSTGIVILISSSCTTYTLVPGFIHANVK